MLISILKIRFITIHCYGLIFVTANSPFHRSPPMKPGNLSFVSKKRRKSSYTISSVIQPLKEKLYICFRKPACNASVTPISSYHPRLPKRTLPNGSATIAKCCSKSLSCPVIHKTNRTIFPKSGWTELWRRSRLVWPTHHCCHRQSENSFQPLPKKHTGRQ